MTKVHLLGGQICANWYSISAKLFRFINAVPLINSEGKYYIYDFEQSDNYWVNCHFTLEHHYRPYQKCHRGIGGRGRSCNDIYAQFVHPVVDCWLP